VFLRPNAAHISEALQELHLIRGAIAKTLRFCRLQPIERSRSGKPMVDGSGARGLGYFVIVAA
jgi:hypothetical protein